MEFIGFALLVAAFVFLFPFILAGLGILLCLVMAGLYWVGSFFTSGTKKS